MRLSISSIEKHMASALAALADVSELPCERDDEARGHGKPRAGARVIPWAAPE